MDPRAEHAQQRAYALQEAMRQLVADTRFRSFMSEVDRMKNEAIRDACRASDHADRDSALGSVRTYIEMLDLYAEAGGDVTLD